MRFGVGEKLSYGIDVERVAKVAVAKLLQITRVQTLLELLLERYREQRHADVPRFAHEREAAPSDGGARRAQVVDEAGLGERPQLDVLLLAFAAHAVEPEFE